MLRTDTPKASKPDFNGRVADGDAVEVDHAGMHGFGEVVALDESNDQGTIVLIPSNESLVVPLNSLRRVAPDAFRRSAFMRTKQADAQVMSADEDLPPPGNLF